MVRVLGWIKVRTRFKGWVKVGIWFLGKRYSQTFKKIANLLNLKILTQNFNRNRIGQKKSNQGNKKGLLQSIK